MQTKYFTLTSPSGHFIFSSDTKLSHAKLIRDTITGSDRGSIPGLFAPPRHKPHFSAGWIREHLPGPVANAAISFEWVPS